MKTYVLKFKDKNSEEHSMFLQSFQTFPEAASWAYIQAGKMGKTWYIEAISEKL